MKNLNKFEQNFETFKVKLLKRFKINQGGIPEEVLQNFEENLRALQKLQ